MLTVRGKALEAGAIGDVDQRAQHPVQPHASRRTVTGPGRVTIAVHDRAVSRRRASPPTTRQPARPPQPE